MLTPQEHEALERWYSEDRVLDRARHLHDEGALEELEEFLHKTALLPLGRHENLPEYLRTDEGAPLFPDNLNPLSDEARWQDAIEVAWEVMRARLGFSHDDVHRAIAEQQAMDWEQFLQSVERRRGGAS